MRIVALTVPLAKGVATLDVEELVVEPVTVEIVVLCEVAVLELVASVVAVLFVVVVLWALPNAATPKIGNKLHKKDLMATIAEYLKRMWLSTRTMLNERLDG
jgi:hypothetical protein